VRLSASSPPSQKPASLRKNRQVLPQTQIAHDESPLTLHEEGWLDRWCSARWRALLTWIALDSISIAVIDLGFLNGIDEAMQRFARYISRFIAVPSSFVTMWPYITLAALFVWFQPLLLRLNGWRSIAWISAVTVVLALALSPPILSHLGDKPWFLLGALGIIVTLPGLTLIGYRSRPWMILIAGILFLPVFAVTASMIRDPRFGGPNSIGLLAANLPYAAVLLYGTKLKTRTAGADAARAHD